jgi:hypothetical protein
MFDLQCRWLTALWQGRVPLPAPDAMRAAARREEEGLAAQGVGEQAFHVLSDRQWDYNQQLAAEAGVEPLEPWRQAIYEDINRIRRLRPWHYKETEYRMDPSSGRWEQLT